MSQSLRIAATDDQRETQEYFRTFLPLSGHVLVVVADTGRELTEKCRAQRPDLIITDIRMPDTDGLEAVAQIGCDAPVPAIVVSAFPDPELIAPAEQEHIMTCLVKPIRHTDLEPAIALATWRFDHFQTLRRETTELKRALDDRKVIERAKGLLMKKARIDEAEAFGRVQMLAVEKNLKPVEK